MATGKFVTAINCMDGRVQEPVIQWMKRQFHADFGFELSHPSQQLPHEFGQFRTLRAAGGGQRQRVAHARIIGRKLGKAAVEAKIF